MPLPLDRLIYIDDSGHPRSGLVVYGWLEFHPSRWSSVLRNWLDLRKKLWVEYKIPVSQELHATEYVNGRGRISTRIPNRFMDNGVERWKDSGRCVAQECLETLRSTEGLSVGAVYGFGDASRLAHTRADTYKALVSRIESQLVQSQTLAMILVDGDGSDPAYTEAHRSLVLRTRHLIEDAIHIESKNSQCIQMADLVAWTANAYVDQHAKNEFARNWYPTYLAERDPRRGPLRI